MAPGPLFAAVIAEGRRSASSGFLISAGHASVEIPLIILLYFFGSAIVFDELKMIIGVLGGLVLLYMAYMELIHSDEPKKEFKKGKSLFTGAIMTLVNPYFILWWLTVGFTLTLNATIFGLMGLLSFILVHELCDFGWLGLVSITSYRTTKIWDKSHKILSMISALIFVAFGIYFIYFGIKGLLA
jgi:threonine/homoserine/homoserine lactone efflux protein